MGSRKYVACIEKQIAEHGQKARTRLRALRRKARQTPGLRSLVGCEWLLRTKLEPRWIVLDVGCGDGSRSAPNALAGAIGIDAHHESLLRLKDSGQRSALIAASFGELPVRPKSVDAVVSLDVIEHFSKPEALRLLFDLEAITKRLVVLMTPNGFIRQDGTPDNPFMEHKSGWTAEEFRMMGYSVYGANGLKVLRGAGARNRWGPLGFAASLLSQLYVKSRPEKAFHLLAVKDMTEIR